MINRGSGGIESGCAEFKMTTVLVICSSLAGADFRAHSDCRYR